MDAISRYLSYLFGIICLLLAFVVGAESIFRKFFAFSLQGVDEISGYTLSLLSGIGFAVALIGRNHTRIDVLYDWFPQKMRAILNWISITLFGIVSVFMTITAFYAWKDSVEYHSTAPTPLATPLMYPQFIWLAALAFFAVISVILSIRACKMLVRGNWGELNEVFPPAAGKKELEKEIHDSQRR